MPQFNTTVLSHVNTFVLVNAQACLDNLRMELSERIIKARLYAKLTQEELAHKVGCTQDMISKLERGERKKTSHIVKIARACSVSVDWMDSGEGEMLDIQVFAKDEREKLVLLAMQSMPDYHKDTAIKILNSLTESESDSRKNGTTATKQ